MFGAFQVESCDELNCFEEIIYEFDISNVGTNFMNITRGSYDQRSHRFVLEQVKSTPWPWSDDDHHGKSDQFK
jgi:hypothetical protein